MKIWTANSTHRSPQTRMVLLILGNKILCSSLVSIAILASMNVVANEGKENQLAQAMLSAIREPVAGEFGESLVTVRNLLGALKKQDLDEYLKCFPIRLELEKSTLEDQVSDLQMYSPELVRRLPGDTYFNLQDILREKVSGYYQFTFGLLMDSPAKMERINPSTPAGQNRLTEIHRMLDLERLEKLKIESVRLKDLPTNLPMPSKLKRLGAEDFRYVSAIASLGENELELLVIVGKFGQFWRVQSVLHSPALSR
jgi:hypothetical protein